jgi:hypothetical protein
MGRAWFESSGSSINILIRFINSILTTPTFREKLTLRPREGRIGHCQQVVAT